MNAILGIGLVVLVVGIFMIIAGIGPLWLPIVVILAGLALTLAGKFRPSLFGVK